MIYLQHHLLLLCLSLLTLPYAAASLGRSVASLPTSNGIFTAQDLPVHFNHQRPLMVSERCPAGYSSCSSLGYSNSCCPLNTNCALDDAGNIACCPFNAACTGTVAACPIGWNQCAQTLGGGCCPSDYACRASSCTLLSPSLSTTSYACSTTSAPVSTPLPNCAYGPPCGYYRPQCCAATEYCYTDLENVAQCTATNTGHWHTYTTTYVETDIETITSTVSSFGCRYSLGEVPCGNICCLAGQFCQSAGQCRPIAGGSTPYYSTTFTTTASPSIHTCAGGRSTVPNAPFPFCYIPTTFVNRDVCSSYWLSCQFESRSCYESLRGADEITVSGPATTSGSTAASSICSELSSSACYGLALPTCAEFPVATRTITTLTLTRGTSTTTPTPIRGTSATTITLTGSTTTTVAYESPVGTNG